MTEAVITRDMVEQVTKANDLFMTPDNIDELLALPVPSSKGEQVIQIQMTINLAKAHIRKQLLEG